MFDVDCVSVVVVGTVFETGSFRNNTGLRSPPPPPRPLAAGAQSTPGLERKLVVGDIRKEMGAMSGEDCQETLRIVLPESRSKLFLLVFDPFRVSWFPKPQAKV